jgi:hypothetical protein
MARIIILITFIASGVMYAQQLQPNQLQVFISAIDGSGKPITDLKPEEIAMTENGAPGKVASMDRHNLPIKLTIAVDNGPDSQVALAAVRTGLTGLVEALPADVEVTLITMAPQPAMFVRPTTDRGVIMKGISRFGVDTEAPRFTETLVEYAERLDKDFKDKKLTYFPMLVFVSTSGAENVGIQRDTIEKGMKLFVARGARMSVAMVSTKPTDAESVANLKQGRQILTATPLINASKGKLETMVQFSGMTTLLPQWGKEIAASHTKQTNQFRTVIERPNNNTGQLNNPGLRITRPGANAVISFDGRFD